MEEKTTITVYTESLFQSLVADLGTIVMLSAMFYVNAKYIQSKFFIGLIMVMYALKIIGLVGARKNVFTSRKEAIEFLASADAPNKPLQDN